MLTEQDMKKLHSAFAAKNELHELRMEMRQEFRGVHFEIRDLGEEFTEKTQLLLNMMDGITKVILEMRMEWAAITTNLNRHDRWIRQLADKTETVLRIE